MRDQTGAAHTTELDHDDDGGEVMNVTLVAWLAHSALGATLLRLLAADEGPKDANIWNPTIIGILTVICAVVLFCGSAYLLLGTNMGGRLGFLVSAAGLTGFLLLLTTLWWTSGSSGIDPPHGRSPQWRVIDVVDSPADSKIEAVRDIATQGQRIPIEQLTNLKPAIDAAIVPEQSLTGEPPVPRPFATLGFSSSTEYLVDAVNLRPYEEGGGTKNIFWHEHQYAAVELCTAQVDVSPPKCDPLKGTKYIILSHDLGTLRQPVVAYWFLSLLLFVLSLLGLHWYEKDQRARAKQTTGLTPVPSPDS